MAERDLVFPTPLGGEDRLFEAPAALAKDFKFGRETVQVFDDMVGRSVPYYAEIQRMVAEMAGDFAVPGTQLYDLGCATGTTLSLLDQTVDPDVSFIGIDNSPEMLITARAKLDSLGTKRRIDLVQSDLHAMPELNNASMIIMLLTLQFVRPLHRGRIMEQISRSLHEQGCLILVEKLTQNDSRLNRLFINYYYNMKKRNGYSETEITQKREALENILIPYRLDENVELLHQAGFRSVEVFFRWYNFCGILALK